MVSEVSRKSGYEYLRLIEAERGSDEAMQGKEKGCVEVTEGLLDGAEKELAAYANAVQILFGSERVHQSIEDWLGELQLMNWSEGDVVPVWRQVTIASAIRIASRVNAPLLKERPKFLSLVVATPLSPR